MMRNQKGITLIALVITIIVLLILAGVSIAMLTGENGILTNATEAQAKTDYNNAVEKIDIALQAIKTEALANLVDDTEYEAAKDTNLVTADVVGSVKTDKGYTISGTDTITIKYENAATSVMVEGSIAFTDEKPSGAITSATGSIAGVNQSGS